MDARVDALVEGAGQWRDAFARLRDIVASCGLDEDVKWGQPCYTLGGKNVVLIHGFKEYCALLFMKGALMADPAGLLVPQTGQVQSGRQIRFTSVQDVLARADLVRAAVEEAIRVEKSGAKVVKKDTPDYPVPEELTRAFDADQAFRDAFGALTPGRQRAYLLHFAQPKQSATRVSRIEKNRDRIMEGLGLND